MYSDREVLCFLQNVPGIGTKTIRELWNYFKLGDRIFHAEEKELENLLGGRQKDAFLKAREKETPAECLLGLRKKEVEYYSVFDWNYPKRLRKVSDAPLALYVRGSLPPEECMTAAVIGARKHSYYGEKQTKVYAKILAEEQVGVVSGMAKGIDSIAQMTALENGGSTYAVLGCGVDVCYPEECRKLYEKLPLYGGIISEYPPGTLPRAGLFPLRNRIISALGDILLVMEARQRSGTLITVDMALEQGKEIWALPGRCDDVLSYGCNRLIAQGAGILTDEDEFRGELELLRQKYERRTKSTQFKREQKEKMFVLGKRQMHENGEPASDNRESMPSIMEEELSLLEQRVLDVLDYQPLALNGIYDKLQKAEETGISLQELAVSLVGLCLKGLAKQINGNFYIRV